MEVLKANHLVKSFGRLKAVDDVSFTLTRGEVLGIVGPNGAGKTTLLNMVTGYLPFDSGGTSFFGTNISGARPEEIVYLGFFRTFQRPRFISELSALENLMLVPLGQKGESWFWSLRKASWMGYESRLKEACSHVLERVGLTEDAHTQCRDLSFGQIKLLNLGFCLLSNAALIALDEPVTGMAPHMRAIAAAILSEDVLDRSYIIIEHDMDFLRQVADRILFISQGKLLSEGPPNEVLDSKTVLEAFLGPVEDDG